MTESTPKKKAKGWQILLALALLAALICIPIFTGSSVDEEADLNGPDPIHQLLADYQATTDVDQLDYIWKTQFQRGEVVRGFIDWKDTWKMLADSTWPRLYVPVDEDPKAFVAKTEGPMLLYAERVLVQACDSFNQRLWLLQNAKYLKNEHAAWRDIQEEDLARRHYPDFTEGEKTLGWLQTDRAEKYFALMFGDQDENIRQENVKEALSIMSVQNNTFEEASKTYFMAAFHQDTAIMRLAKARMVKKTDNGKFDHWLML